MIPTCAVGIYKKFRKYYAGDADDLKQAAALALWEWAREFEDYEKIPDSFLPVVEAAMLAEIEKNRRENIPMEYGWVPVREEEEERVTRLRNRVRKQLDLLFHKLEYNAEQKDIVYRHFLYEQTANQIKDEVNSKPYRKKPKLTKEDIDRLLGEARYFLKTRLTADLAGNDYAE